MAARLPCLSRTVAHVPRVRWPRLDSTRGPGRSSDPVGSDLRLHEGRPSVTLREKQSLFARLIARLLLHAELLGHDTTLGKFFESRASARDRGNLGSLHPLKLAGDINLFIDGKYQRSTKAHEPLGVFWESLNPLCRWGGRFNDGNHYSVEHGGHK